MSRILSVSTSGSVASVAYFEDGKALMEKVSGSVSHSSAVGALTDELFKELGREAHDLDYLAVDIGPGSFTGVRIGVSFINGMALALGKPIIPITSLSALRYNVPDKKTVAAMIDARNSSVYGAVFEGGACIIAPGAYPVNDFISVIPKGAVCVGDGAESYEEMIVRGVEDVALSSVQYNKVTAMGVGFAAWSAVCANNAESVEFAVPLYLRPSQAERVRDMQKQL